MFNGNLLRKLREERNLTQEDLASRVNLTRHSIIRFESGMQDPSIRMLCAIADALGVPPAIFLG